MKNYLTPDPQVPGPRSQVLFPHPTAAELRRVVQATLQELRDTTRPQDRLLHAMQRTRQPRRRSAPATAPAGAPCSGRLRSLR